MTAQCTIESATLQKRFDEKYIPEPMSGCWLWLGAIDSKGYGHISNGPRRIMASRASWLLAHGSFPNNLYVLHRCDNPACVNPDHLFLGTHQDNMDDMMAKGRRAVGDKVASKGENHPGAKLKDADIINIRRDHKNGEPQTSIAKRLNMSLPPINQIVNRKSWKHIP